MSVSVSPLDILVFECRGFQATLPSHVHALVAAQGIRECQGRPSPPFVSGSADSVCEWSNKHPRVPIMQISHPLFRALQYCTRNQACSPSFTTSYYLKFNTAYKGANWNCKCRGGGLLELFLQVDLCIFNHYFFFQLQLIFCVLLHQCRAYTYLDRGCVPDLLYMLWSATGLVPVGENPSKT